ncbi:MAG: HMA2 domain-containing protein [Bacillus sp. (in: firmicutes)]
MLNTILGIGASLLAPKIMSKVQDQKVNVVHASPGRVRLQCNSWKNEQTAKNLLLVFRGIPLIKHAETSADTGSLLLEFRSSALTQEQFDAIVQKAVETSVATYPEMEAQLMSALRSIIGTIDTTMKKQSGGKLDIDSLLSVTLIISGVLKLPANPAFSSSLLYWAYTIITNKGKSERRDS